LRQIYPIEFLLLLALLLVPATNRVSSWILQDTARAASLLLGGNREVQSGEVTHWRDNSRVIAFSRFLPVVDSARLSAI